MGRMAARCTVDCKPDAGRFQGVLTRKRLSWGAQVQYPDALKTMMSDLVSIRKWADFLQRTELKFDMVSAVDELAKQVPLPAPHA